MADPSSKGARELPAVWRAAGRLLRSAPPFPGRYTLRQALGKRVRGRGWSTTIAFDQGQRIALNLDDWIPSLVFLTGFYDVERAHTLFFRSAVKEGAVVIDVGANVGYYTLQAARRAGASGVVHAFEPVAAVHENLARNVRMNGFTNVVLNKCAVHEQPGEITINVSDASNTGGSSVLWVPSNSKGHAERVPVTTLDRYAEEKGIARVDLVKIDVEGSEMGVLRGARGLLAKTSPQLLVEITEESMTAQGTTAGGVIGFLADLGYRPWRITERGPERVAERDVRHESLLLFRKEA